MQRVSKRGSLSPSAGTERAGVAGVALSLRLGSARLGSLRTHLALYASDDVVPVAILLRPVHAPACPLSHSIYRGRAPLDDL